MFWKKKEQQPDFTTGKEQINKVHKVFAHLGNHRYQKAPMWCEKRLVLQEDLVDLERLQEKLDLILEHLKLKYVPESKETKEAHLVAKQITEDWMNAATSVAGIDLMAVCDIGDEPKKKKRGRPKGSKNKPRF